MWIERNLRYDLWLIMAVVALVGAGIVMIYSTSSISAHHTMSGQSAFFLKRQIMFAFIGLGAMLVAMRVNHERLRIVTMPMLGLFMGAAWIAADFFLTRRTRRSISAGRAALYGVLLGLIVGMMMAGFRGFTMAGGSTLFNYFTMGIGGMGAWLHRRLAGRTG